MAYFDGICTKMVSLGPRRKNWLIVSEKATAKSNRRLPSGDIGASEYVTARMNRHVTYPSTC